MKAKTKLQQGSVSLFVVVFSALLIITMTTAFIRIMLQDQLQATANDLSKSALDSAYAGVEDAKRAIVAYYDSSCDKDSSTPQCADLKKLAAVDANGWTQDCDITKQTNVATQTNGEFTIKTATSDNQFNQAYTCVKVQLEPDNYVGKLKANTSTIIPLQTKSGAVFDQIKIEWYTEQDGPVFDDATTSPAVPFPKLPTANSWPTNRPSVIRAQLLQYDKDAGFKLSDFDDATHNSTLFLYPTNLSGLRGIAQSFDVGRRADATAPSLVEAGCNTSFTTTEPYACQSILTPPGSIAKEKRVAYLNLIQLYDRPTTYQVTLIDSTTGDAVKLSGVQPVVDSTGRANDLFRRVQSRINLGTSTAPDSAIDLTDKLCKTFTVTDTQYVDSGPCAN